MHFETARLSARTLRGFPFLLFNKTKEGVSKENKVRLSVMIDRIFCNITVHYLSRRSRSRLVTLLVVSTCPNRKLPSQPNYLFQ